MNRVRHSPIAEFRFFTPSGGLTVIGTTCKTYDRNRIGLGGFLGVFDRSLGRWTDGLFDQAGQNVVEAISA